MTYKFLEALTKSTKKLDGEIVSSGLLLLINLRDSLHLGLLSTEVTRSFLNSCSQQLQKHPAQDPLLIWEEVRKRGLRKSKNRPALSYRWAAKQHDHHFTNWTKVGSAEAFWVFQIDNKSVQGLNPLLYERAKLTYASTIGKAPDELQDTWEQTIDLVERTPTLWNEATHSEGAWLGRPSKQGAACWVSTTELDMQANAFIAEDTGTDSVAVCDALGITFDKDETPICIRYTFPSIEAISLAGGVVAQPTALDGGSEWFRVRPTAFADADHRRYGWGSTQHLHLRSVKHSGRPERVIPSLPIRKIKGLSLKAIIPKADLSRNRLTYAQMESQQLAGQTSNDVINDIKKLIKNVKSNKKP